MQVKLLNFRYSSALGGFDDALLIQFLGDKDVVSFTEHFYTVEGVPHLVCVVRWNSNSSELPPEVPGKRPGSSEIAPRSNGPGPDNGRERRDPSAALGEPQRALYAGLRAWRAERARAEGVPAYRVFTNAQLCELVLRRPGSAEELVKIPGIGAARAELYGNEVVARLQESSASRAASPGPVSSGAA